MLLDWIYKYRVVQLKRDTKSSFPSPDACYRWQTTIRVFYRFLSFHYIRPIRARQFVRMEFDCGKESRESIPAEKFTSAYLAAGCCCTWYYVLLVCVWRHLLANAYDTPLVFLTVNDNRRERRTRKRKDTYATIFGPRHMIGWHDIEWVSCSLGGGLWFLLPFLFFSFLPVVCGRASTVNQPDKDRTSNSTKIPWQNFNSCGSVIPSLCV